jgi:hypothetical protein
MSPAKELSTFAIVEVRRLVIVFVQKIPVLHVGLKGFGNGAESLGLQSTGSSEFSKSSIANFQMQKAASSIWILIVVARLIKLKFQ